MGRGRRCPATSAAFASGQLPAPIHTRAPGQGRPVRLRRPGTRAAGAGCRRPSDLTPQIQVRARRADEIRPPGLTPRRYLARAVAPSRAARGAAGPRKSYFSMGPQGPLSRGAGTAAEQRACAATRPDFRTAGEALRVAESPQLPASARRARTGRTPPHTHTRCTLTVSRAPPLCQGTTGSRHPARAPPSSPDPSTLLQRPGITSRGVTEATHPVGRPGQVPQHRTATARPGPTRGREEGAAL